MTRPERPNGLSLREYVDLRLDHLERITCKTEMRLDSLEITRAQADGKASRSLWLAVGSLLVALASLVAHIVEMP